MAKRRRGKWCGSMAGGRGGNAVSQVFDRVTRDSLGYQAVGSEVQLDKCPS